MDKITVIVPCYNEQEVLPLFYQEIEKVRSGMPEVDFEYLFVNDGSSDRTLPMLRELSSRTAGSSTSRFPATLEKRRQCMPAWIGRPATIS